MKSRTLLILLGGMLSIGVLATSADAVTLQLNGDGSSAGRGVMGFAPGAMCAPWNASTNVIKHYRDSNSATANYNVWLCNLPSGDALQFRYHATGSADAWNHVQAASAQNEMNEAASTCSGPTHVVVTGFNEWDDYICSTVVTFTQTINFGGSDVKKESFGQTGPSNYRCPGDPGPPVQPSLVPPILAPNTPFPCSAPVPVAPNVKSSGGPIVPFAIVVGKAVQKWNPPAPIGTGPAPNGSVAGAVGSLSRDQIERIFTGEITDWQQIGLATVAPVNGELAPSGTAADATSPIDVCTRSAGSGSKASLQRTLMLLSTENTIGDTAVVHPGLYHGKSSSDVLTCLGLYPNGIGIQDADAVPLFPTQVTISGGHYAAYPVKINGFAVSEAAYDPGPFTPAAGSTTVDQRKLNIRCGQYPFWVQWQITQPTAAYGDARDAAMTALTTAAAGTTLIDHLKGDPTVSGDPLAGHFWVAGGQMAFQKATDRGPMLADGLNHPECFKAD